MATVASLLPQSPLRNESRPTSSHRPLPIHTLSATPSESASDDPMDLTPIGPGSMGPPGSASPNGKPNSNSGSGEQTSAGASSQTLGVATATQQPKVVQTAFIHKLYKWVG